MGVLGPEHRRRALRCIRELLGAVNECVVKPAEARAASAAERKSGSTAARGIGGARTSLTRLPWVVSLCAELRENFRETDPARAEERCQLAERYTAHLRALSSHRDMVHSYGWALDEADDMERVRRTAARVGLSVPEAQNWDSGRISDLLLPPKG